MYLKARYLILLLDEITSSEQQEEAEALMPSAPERRDYILSLSIQDCRLPRIKKPHPVASSWLPSNQTTLEKKDNVRPESAAAAIISTKLNSTPSS